MTSVLSPHMPNAKQERPSNGRNVTLCVAFSQWPQFLLMRQDQTEPVFGQLFLQEGQHPLTEQLAANFRLLANQWAERRLVMQWRHGCRAMRRSVCNAGDSNAGRSLCIQMSRERSYPLPIYWYHSKGNWLRYNFAADSFWVTVCKTVRPMLSVGCLSVLSCLSRSCTEAKRLDGSRRNLACR